MKNLRIGNIWLIIKNNYITNRSIAVLFVVIALILGCIIGALPTSHIEGNYMVYKDEYGSEVPAYIRHEYENDIKEVYDGLLGNDGAYINIYESCILILALIFAISVNSFLREKSANDFYHSLSINRKEIFMANCLTVFINMAATIIISQLGGLLAIQLIAKYHPLSFGEMLLKQLPGVLTILLFSALYTVIAIISTICAGTILSSIVNYYFIIFYIPATIMITALASAALFNTPAMDCIEHNPCFIVYSSPYIRHLFSKVALPLTAVSYILIFLATVVLTVIGAFIYSARKNENNAKPLPYTKMTHSLRYLVTYDAIVIGVLIFIEITGTVTWGIIGGILAAFFSFAACNAFANKSFNNILKGAHHLIFIIIITVVIGIVFIADVFNMYKEPVPNVDGIESGYLSVDYTYKDHTESYSYNFVDQEDEYEGSIVMTKESQQYLKELWILINEDQESLRNDVEGEDHLTISMSIDCSNDFSSYNVYLYVHKNHKNYERIIEIVEIIGKKYTASNTNIYYFEDTETQDLTEDTVTE